MKSLFLFLVLSLVLINGCINSQENTQETTQNPVITNNPPANPQTSEIKTFKLTTGNLKFTMDGVQSPDLKVKLGDKVRIEVTNEQGIHDFMMDEFNVATTQLTTGKSDSVEFTADKKGTFEYYCSVGTHRQMGMKGKFIVE